MPVIAMNGNFYYGKVINWSLALSLRGALLTDIVCPAVNICVLCCLSCAQCPPGMKQQVLLFYTKLLGRIRQPLLPHINVHRPVQVPTPLTAD